MKWGRGRGRGGHEAGAHSFCSFLSSPSSLSSCPRVRVPPPNSGSSWMQHLSPSAPAASTLASGQWHALQLLLFVNHGNKLVLSKAISIQCALSWLWCYESNFHLASRWSRFNLERQRPENCSSLPVSLPCVTFLPSVLSGQSSLLTRKCVWERKRERRRETWLWESAVNPPALIKCQCNCWVYCFACNMQCIPEVPRGKGMRMG